MRKAHANNMLKMRTVCKLGEKSVSHHSHLLRVFRIGSDGFTLTEILIVSAVVAILASFASLSLLNLKHGQDLVLDADLVVAALRDAQQRSIVQDEDSQWGVHFVNNPSGQDTYEVFKGAVYSNVAYFKKPLHTNVEFQNSGSWDVVFSKLTGFPSAPSTIIICLSGTAPCKTITVSSNGTITY